MKVRSATIDDLPSIVMIYNYAIVEGVATFDTELFTIEERMDWFHRFDAEGFPLLVCVADDGDIAGYAYYLPYRSKPAYDTTREVTIYVDTDYHRMGVGSLLYAVLIDRARADGVHSLIAVLGGENAASRALHEKFGFTFVGHYREVGRKFGKWVDTFSYQKILHQPVSPDA